MPGQCNSTSKIQKLYCKIRVTSDYKSVDMWSEIRTLLLYRYVSEWAKSRYHNRLD